MNCPAFIRERALLVSAMLLFIFSLSATVLLASTISASHPGADSGLFGTIPFGKKYYRILSGSDCVGVIESELAEVNSGHSITSQGVIRLAGPQTRSEVTVRLDAAFNAIGQLGASALRLSSSGIDVSVGTLNIHPMTVKGRARVYEQQRNFESLVDGPVMLEEVEAGKFMIRYAYLDTFGAASHDTLQQPFLQNLQLAIEEIPSDDTACRQSTGKELDVTEILSRLNALSQTLLKARGGA